MNRYLISLILGTTLTTSVASQITTTVEFSFCSVNSTYYNMLNTITVDLETGIFIIPEIGFSFFSDMKSDNLASKVNYYKQIAIKSPYLLIKVKPVKSGKNDLILGAGLAVGKIEENRPLSYSFLTDDLVLMYFSDSDYWTAGIITSLDYHHCFSNKYIIGASFTYTKFNKFNAPYLISFGINLGIKL